MPVEKVSAEVFLGGACVVHFGNPMGHPKPEAAVPLPATPQRPATAPAAARPAKQ